MLNIRTQKIAKVIQKELSVLLNNKIEFNFAKIITISDVKVSKDLMYAKIFVSFLHNKDPNLIRSQIKYLQKKDFLLRKIIAKKQLFRVVPLLKFVYDDSLTKSIYISNLINKVIK